jgi:hypothetical protein
VLTDVSPPPSISVPAGIAWDLAVSATACSLGPDSCTVGAIATTGADGGSAILACEGTVAVRLDVAPAVRYGGLRYASGVPDDPEQPRRSRGYLHRHCGPGQG